MILDVVKFESKWVKNGSLKDVLPELYDLANVIENNDWHVNQNVFDHSISALEALESYTSDKFELLAGDNFQYKLVSLAVLLHDIGKLEALHTNKDRRTIAPSHAQVGSVIAIPLLQRLELSESEIRFVTGLVGDHIFACDLLELAVKNSDKKYISLLKEARPQTWKELLFVAYADIQGCNPATDQIKEESQARTVLIESALSS